MPTRSSKVSNTTPSCYFHLLVQVPYCLQAAGVAPAYIRQVLAAFDSMAATSTAPASSGNPTRRTVRQDVPVETLTHREIDVLRLLAQRLPDKEIAERLVLSPDTVKKHTQRIYRKLGVDNRRAAAAQAHRLGLIEMP